MEREKDATIPKFASLEEEREYWESRGPLAEAHKATVNRPRPRQKRSSFLAVRFTGEELTRLRDTAAQLGLGPSTFARLVLISALENPERWRKLVTLDQIKERLESNLTQDTKDLIARFATTTTIGDANSPSLLLMDATQMKQAEELALPILRVLLATAGVQLITPEDENYEKVRDAATSRR